jgi:type II secretory pathway pseudopilin PulG
MGQQQLLLVILVTIIVGIATVIAITTFGNAADNANIDAVRNDLGSIALAAQGYYLKPILLGGGDKDFNGFTFDGVAFAGLIPDDAEDLIITNENGTFEITSAAGNELVVEAIPASDEERTFTATIRPNAFEIAESEE